MPAARYENTPLDIRPRSSAALPALPTDVAVDPMPLAQIHWQKFCLLPRITAGRG